METYDLQNLLCMFRTDIEQTMKAIIEIQKNLVAIHKSICRLKKHEEILKEKIKEVTK